MASTSIQQSNRDTSNSDNIQWIHCNACNKFYEKNNSFYLLSCSNVMCRNCFKKGGRTPFCTLCKKFVSFKIINETLEPKYIKLFQLDTSYESYVEEFQYKHVLNLAKNVAKAEKMEDETKKQMQKLIQYNDHYKKLRAERKQMQEQLKIVYSMNRHSVTTPVERGRMPGSNNNSMFSMPSAINKSTTSSLHQLESAKHFFSNRGSSSSSNKAPYRKKYDLSSAGKFNTHFKPPIKSTPIFNNN